MSVKSLLNNKNFKSIINEISDVAGYLWNKNWAEANAGNISVILESRLYLLNKKLFSEKIPLQKSYNYLANELLLITSSGSRMRDIRKNPLDYLCLIIIDSKGTSYKLYNLSGNVLQPTSEIKTHLEIQNQLRKNKSKCKVVLHTHPSEIIALTCITKYKSEKSFNNLIKTIHPEILFSFPEGVAYLKYLLTGSMKLARNTAVKFDKYKLCIWEMHGVVSIGKNLSEAFDYIDIIAKTAKLYFLCKSSNQKFEGLKKSQIDELKNAIKK
jgi:rhamnulose-1-phosphate aldolase